MPPNAVDTLKSIASAARNYVDASVADAEVVPARADAEVVSTSTDHFFLKKILKKKKMDRAAATAAAARADAAVARAITTSATAAAARADAAVARLMSIDSTSQLESVARSADMEANTRTAHAFSDTDMVNNHDVTVGYDVVVATRTAAIAADVVVNAAAPGADAKSVSFMAGTAARAIVDAVTDTSAATNTHTLDEVNSALTNARTLADAVAAVMMATTTSGNAGIRATASHAAIDAARAVANAAYNAQPKSMIDRFPLQYTSVKVFANNAARPEPTTHKEIACDKTIRATSDMATAISDVAKNANGLATIAADAHAVADDIASVSTIASEHARIAATRMEFVAVAYVANHTANFYGAGASSVVDSRASATRAGATAAACAAK